MLGCCNGEHYLRRLVLIFQVIELVFLYRYVKGSHVTVIAYAKFTRIKLL